MRRVAGIAILAAVCTAPFWFLYAACVRDEGWAMASLIFGSVAGGVGLFVGLMTLGVWLVES